MSLKYVATGAGHTGTGYVMQLLRSAGVRCGHENIFTAGRVVETGDEVLDADSSFAAAAYLEHPLCEGAQVIHIVRDPLATLCSLVVGRTDENNNAWCSRVLGGIDEPDKVLWQARYILEWNRLIERESEGMEYMLYKVEDRLALLDRLELEQVTEWDNPLYNIHVWPRRELTWDDVPVSSTKGELQDMAARYGYA